MCGGRRWTQSRPFAEELSRNLIFQPRHVEFFPEFDAGLQQDL